MDLTSLHLYDVSLHIPVFTHIMIYAHVHMGVDVLVFLEFYVLATPKDISGWRLTCDSVRSWWLYSAVPTGRSGCQHHDLKSHSVTLSSHWPTNQSLPYPNNPASYKCQFEMPLVSRDQEPNSISPTSDARALLIRPPHIYMHIYAYI